MRRASWPSAINSRAPWCAVAQASRPTRHGGTLAKNARTWLRRSRLRINYAACLVDRMNLEDTLCQIKTNCCNIAHGWLPLLVIFDDTYTGTLMPSGGHT